jgi:hypothetical protein
MQVAQPDTIRLNEHVVNELDDHNKERRSEDERRELDTHNLTLQSLNYGKDYFLKEVHFCKEYKTPHLQQALHPDVYLQRFKNLPPNVTET